jgi:triosephosphate isomerase (TIM)
MRRKLFAANWKMNLDPVQARELIQAIRKQLDPQFGTLGKERDVMIAPPAILIPAAAQELAGAAIALGAQNMHFEDQGAFTGEISAPMLKAYGVKYVILGHSERRHIFGETDELINKKVKTALRHGLLPVLCVGETLAQREAGDTTEVLTVQLLAGLQGLEDAQVANVIIAYEPVWAIGTGKTATPDQAQTDHGALRGTLIERAGRDVAHSIRILYGGSVTAENVDSLVSKPDIDGALVGGASLKADAFVRIVRALTV